MTEAQAIPLICALLGGEPEVRLHFEIDSGSRFVQIDCLTDTHAIEVGLDKRSSLDSYQQASFAAWVSGRKPMIVIVDTDGVQGVYEYRIEAVARENGVLFQSISKIALDAVASN